MRERPILFSAPMVRAILEGRKTVTRRVVKPQPEYRDVAGLFASWVFKGGHLYPNAKDKVLAMCPYGQPGDRLWVRETFANWQTRDLVCGGPVSVIAYRAGRQWRNGNRPDRAPNEVYWEDDSKPEGVKWAPSIHMPRAASRITLEVTGVRVERLQDISDDQAAAEGIHRVSIGSGYQDRFSAKPVTWADAVETNAGHEDPSLAFRDLWESINGAGSWAANPWVWAVEFRRITP